MTGGLPAIQTRKKMVKVICNQALDEMLVWRRPCLLSWCSLSSLTLVVETQVLVQVIFNQIDSKQFEVRIRECHNSNFLSFK